MKDYNLYHTEKLDTVFHEPDGKEVRVECIFQIWSKHHDSFEDLPGQKGYGVVFHREIEEMTQIAKETNWADVSFLSTNSALNLRTSKILEVFIKKA